MHFLSLVLAAPLALSTAIPPYGVDGQQLLEDPADFNCDLPSVLDPSADGLPSSQSLFSSKAALRKQVDRHSALVRVPTVCYDDLGPIDEDPRWKPYHRFHEVLAETFPLLHKHFKRETFNKYGLLYTLPGSDPTLKPILLTAHQDVVPVGDPAAWTHPPFDAYFDGTWLWGRGSADDKNSLTAILSAAEALLSQGFSPKRTVLLGFGFDEECGGVKGAGAIADHLRSTLGEDSLALVLDEGGMGLQQIDDVLYALPAVVEKGHVNTYFELHVQGGHSSIPFPHTGIGIISEIVVALESHPYEPRLIKGSPIYNHYVCQARYSPDAAPRVTRLLEEGDLESLAVELAGYDRPTNFRLQTSQAVDLIAGGQKINAMPEVVTLAVNYRIAPHNTVGEVLHNTVKYIQPIVKKYGLNVKALEDDEEYRDYTANGARHGGDAGADGDVKPLYDVDYNGTLILRSKGKGTPPPVAPSSGEVWDVFSGTIQHSFAFDGGKVVPVGELMTGNTDTRHYLDFTRNVYRWAPARQGGIENAHTINERVNITVHLELVKFYYDLLRNFDASDVAKTTSVSGELEL
ncbi:hypothetical protein SLS53_001683 [Cytospora paraplurivora]|uniref:Peptidase M20 dimerisation domain-containing protein n=1 Tax=Cytospora paraplurivora TaxID=2898453 RepID=A0AAN9URF6_9PEZI